MNFKQFVRDYFTFSRNERKGVIILLLVIFILAVANKMIFYFEKPAKLDEALFDSAKHELALFNDSVNLDFQKQSIKSNDLGFEERNSSDNSEKDDEKGLTFNRSTSNDLFKFDPNKCSEEDFRRLGFSDKQAEVIQKYRATGVVFRSKEDFFKIRIISEKQKQALSSWIEIPESVTSLIPAKETKEPLLIEINTADSLRLEQLSGIGKVLSKRIIKYRDMLGGFYAIDQLKEVYGLTESTFVQIEKNIRIDKSGIRKIDFSFGDINDLARHPYIKRNLAGKIIKFRSRYGNISNPAILRDSLILTNEEYNKIKPYF
jgi:competence ComEA-like helix-hairpin-helix protein